MNKYALFATFFCVLALSSAAPQDSSSDEEKQLRELAQSVKDKFNTTLLLDIINMADKAKEKCPDIEDKVESVFTEIGSCLEDVELGSETFCSLIKKNYAKCTKPARDLVISCLPEESKDLPILGEKMVLAVIDTACSSTVEQVLEWFNPCAMEKDPEDIAACKSVKTTVDEYKNKLPSKSLICSTLPKMRGCAKEILSTSCKNEVTRTSVNKFYDAIEVSIKDECDALNKA